MKSKKNHLQTAVDVLQNVVGARIVAVTDPQNIIRRVQTINAVVHRRLRRHHVSK